MPFFKLMKRKGPFEWTQEADEAFQDLKKYLTSPPVMVAPRPQEPLVLYLAATPYSASAAPVAVREEHRAKTAPVATTPGQEGPSCGPRGSCGLGPGARAFGALLTSGRSGHPRPCGRFSPELALRLG